jgi:two-component system sensor histidine kinase RegB
VAKKHASEIALFEESARANWIRVRTLIGLRWLAIAGQLAAMAIGKTYFSLSLDLGLCLMVVGAGIIFNLIATFILPKNKRLDENEALSMIIFDLGQLALLLFLTGGMNNPFAVLLIAPVTISATALSTRSTIIVGGLTLLLITTLTTFYIPLRTTQGFIHAMPSILLFGFWASMCVGVIFIGLYARRVTVEMNTMSNALIATQMALAREQKLTDLGGVVAAAAHELGTPLATIKLVSTELMEELSEQTDLYDDARLIREQSERCREILRSMGRVGKEDKHLMTAPISAVIQEASEPHLNRGKAVNFDIPAIDKNDGIPQPQINRSPEIIHGLRNLIQNAVDFSQTQVWVDVQWSQTEITLRITDDGDGFSQQVFSRIGDPFVKRRNSHADQQKRPGYQGMGLGLFIAKTLLERSGATLRFSNGSDPAIEISPPLNRSGAIVEVSWPASKIVSAKTASLGDNDRLES